MQIAAKTFSTPFRKLPLVKIVVGLLSGYSFLCSMRLGVYSHLLALETQYLSLRLECPLITILLTFLSLLFISYCSWCMDPLLLNTVDFFFFNDPNHCINKTIVSGNLAFQTLPGMLQGSGVSEVFLVDPSRSGMLVLVRRCCLDW